MCTLHKRSKNYLITFSEVYKFDKKYLMKSVLKSEFKLIFQNKIFIIPTNIKFFTDVDTKIYLSLINNHEYEIHSQVNENICQSFINHCFTGEIPHFNSDNISQYQLLSEEFDRMKDLIELYQIKSGKSFYLSRKNEEIRKKIQEKKDNHHKRNENFRKINQILFLKNIFSSLENFKEIKNELYEACRIKDIDYVNFLTKKRIQQDDLIYVLDEKEKTAGLLSTKNEKENIFVPRSIFYEKEEFLVTSIIKNSFQNSQSIKSIQFPVDSELKIIESYSFHGSSLQSISIPFRVTRIEEHAFSYCRQFKKLELPENSELKFIGNNIFKRSSIETISIPSSVVEICNDSLASTRRLTNIKIIDREEKNISFYDDSFIIGKSTLEQDDYDTLIVARKDIKTVTIPSFIKYINPHAFEHCLSIEEIKIDQNSELISIGEFSFSSSSIQHFIIPLHVKIIKKNSFSFCNKLNEIHCVENSELKVIEEDAFSDSSITAITIPSSVEIRKGSFSSTPKLNNIKIIQCKEKNVCYFDDSLLIGKSNQKQNNYDVLIVARKDIKIETIPSFIKYIDPNAFEFCTNLKQIKFNKNSQLFSIGDQSFKSSQIESIIFPPSIVQVGKLSFYNCKNLKKIEFANDSNLMLIEKSCFLNSSIESLVLPSCVIIDDKCFGYAEKLNEIKIIPSKQKNISLYNDLLVKKSSQTNDNYDILIIAKRNIKNAIIPSFIKRISSNAFYKCLNLDTIEFSEDSELKSIDSHAFAQSSIQNIIIPSKTEKIGEYSFNLCKKLQKFETSIDSKLKTIDSFAFSDSSIESFSIPSSVIDIKNGCFVKTPKLTKLNIFRKEEKNFSLYDNNFIIGKSSPEQNNFDVIIVAKRNIKNVVIPSFIKQIDYCAFYECSQIQRLIINEDSQLNTICSYSFGFSSIKSVYIPKNVHFIDNYAFYLCSNLNIIEFANSEIKNFGDCFHKGIIMIPNSSF